MKVCTRGMMLLAFVVSFIGCGGGTLKQEATTSEQAMFFCSPDSYLCPAHVPCDCCGFGQICVQDPSQCPICP